MSNRYDHHLILGYLESDLGRRDASRFRKQLSQDPRLRNLVAQLVLDRQALRQLPAVPAPRDLIDAVTQRLERDMLLQEPPAGDEQTVNRSWRGRRLAYAGLAVLVGVSATVVWLIVDRSVEVWEAGSQPMAADSSVVMPGAARDGPGLPREQTDPLRSDRWLPETGASDHHASQTPSAQAVIASTGPPLQMAGETVQPVRLEPDLLSMPDYRLPPAEPRPANPDDRVGARDPLDAGPVAFEPHVLVETANPAEAHRDLVAWARAFDARLLDGPPSGKADRPEVGPDGQRRQFVIQTRSDRVRMLVAFMDGPANQSARWVAQDAQDRHEEAGVRPPTGDPGGVSEAPGRVLPHLDDSDSALQLFATVGTSDTAEQVSITVVVRAQRRDPAR